MKPGELNFRVDANRDFGLTFRVFAAGQAIDFAGWQFAWEAREQPGQTGPALLRLAGPGPRIEPVPGQPGMLAFSIPWEMLEPHIGPDPFNGRRLYHDFIATETDGWRNMLFYGQLFLKPGVTRP